MESTTRAVMDDDAVLDAVLGDSAGTPEPVSVYVRRREPVIPETVDLQKVKFRLLVLLCLSAMAVGFVVDEPGRLLEGTLAIISSPSNLLTDYFAIASAGAVFLNAGALTLASVILVRLEKTEFSGPIIAGIFTVFGFALFGKNLFNSIPITLGVFLYARLERKRFGDYQVESLFATALGPAVSYLAFGTGMPVWAGILLGWSVGIVLGMVVPPLSVHFKKFHHGLSLYNIGFTAGIVGMVVVAIKNMAGADIATASHISTGLTPWLATLVAVFSVALLVCGFVLNGRSLHGMAHLMRRSGQAPSDFVALEGVGRTIMNMGLLGLMSLAFVLAVGGELNGPVLGGIFTVVGFGAYGKHPRNCWPILAGVTLGALLTGADLSSTQVIMTALFATTLAPIAGVYGSIYGVVAGLLHMGLVANLGFLHGGLNLYNHGFAAGFAAFVLYPVFNAKLRIRGKHDRIAQHAPQH
ncbi:DUF1576 domain-containing protein [Xylanimonas cellulosilytica]|nr:DUF1576 domain-containing protein [Xylanimonas cellulosilytica]